MNFQPLSGLRESLSDTRDRFLRVLFFKQSDSVLHARIEHIEKKGALSSITKALRLGGFNILTSHSTIGQPNGRAKFDVVVNLVQLSGEHNIKQTLINALSVSDLEDLELFIGYPKDYYSPWTKKAIPIELSSESSPLPHDSEVNVSSLHEEAPVTDKIFKIVESYKKALARKLNREGLLGDDQKRWALIHQLSAQYARWSGRLGKRTLFISCHFSSSNHLFSISKVAEQPEFKFDVITGKDLVEFQDKSEGLINKIKSCSHFLGVWSARGGLRLGSEIWPSPWLLWELGVAQAHGLRWRLLISGDVASSAWAKINTQQQHLIYTEDDFSVKLHRALQALSNLNE